MQDEVQRQRQSAGQIGGGDEGRSMRNRQDRLGAESARLSDQPPRSPCCGQVQPAAVNPVKARTAEASPADVKANLLHAGKRRTDSNWTHVAHRHSEPIRWILT